MTSRLQHLRYYTYQRSNQTIKSPNTRHWDMEHEGCVCAGAPIPGAIDQLVQEEREQGLYCYCIRQRHIDVYTSQRGTVIRL